MKTISVCISTLAALQLVLSAPQDFSSFFDTPASLQGFRPNNYNNGKQQTSDQLASRSSWNTQRSKADTSSGFGGSNSYKWSTSNNNNKLSSRSMSTPRHMYKQQRTQTMTMSNDAFPQLRQSSIPVISVPPLLPPIPGVTEQDLYGSVNIDALTAPYSLGDNSTENQTPIQLPDTNEVVNGSANVYDHGFANSNKVQDVVSNHLINTFTNQNNHVQVNNLDLHRFYKLVNATTNYVTNVQRVNQSAIFNQITNNNATEYQPFLYITQSQTNTINDSGQAVQLPVIESSSVSSVALPPVYDTPVVTKFDYNGNPVPVSN